MASLSKQPKELQERHRKILLNELKKPENRECADCRSRRPTWASVSLGVFLCLECSGAHRGLGVHLSQVRSVDMDTWLPEHVAFVATVGNRVANGWWLARHPDAPSPAAVAGAAAGRSAGPDRSPRPPECDRAVVRDKYERGRWARGRRPRRSIRPIATRSSSFISAISAPRP